MTEKYTIADITSDLGFLLTLTKLFEADDKGFWVDSSTEKRFVHKLDANDEGREIVNFQDPMPKGNFYYFNPFSEGFGRKSPATNLYFRTIRVALNVNIRMIALHVANEALASKTDTAKSMDPAVIRMCSVPVDKKSTLFDVLDDKMIDEFEKLLGRMDATEANGCLNIPYLHQQMTAKVKCDVLTDPKWEEKYGTDVRKKSITAFRALMMGILGLKTPEDLESFTTKYDPDLKSSARLHTTMTVYLKLYSKFNDILSELDAIDLGGLQEVIERFPAAYAIAKHMIQPAINIDPVSTSSTDTSKLTFSNQAGGRRFSATPIAPSMTGTPAFNSQSGGSGRFQPIAINPAQQDPFSPSNVANVTPGWSGGGMQQVTPYATSGGYFGNPQGYTSPQQAGGFSFSAPSTFNSPATRRSYF